VEFNAQDLKNLREKTGAGMLDCKNALVEAGGDCAKAERKLKELGLAAASKKGGRATNSGLVFAKVAPRQATLVELTCETDFVARNSLFLDLGKTLVESAFEKGLSEKTEAMDLLVREAIGKIKENMQIRRVVTVSAGAGEVLVDYVHDGRIGVVLRFRLSAPALETDARVKETLFHCALHVAAFAPAFFSRDKVPAAWLKEQEEIFTKQVEGMEKPANVLAGIVKGKVNKLLADVCFLEQPFVKDEKRKVAKVLEDLGKEVGGRIEAVDFVYLKVGEETS
jgi:elongation factor Ts